MKTLIISLTALAVATLSGIFILLKLLDFDKKILSGDMLLLISTITAILIITIYITTALTLDYFWRSITPT